MTRRNERGAVLVTALLILALLSILGAGSLLVAWIDTKTVQNGKLSREHFYAAEAAMTAGVTDLTRHFRTNNSVFVPDAAAVALGSLAGHPVSLADFPNFTAISYVIENDRDIAPGVTPDRLETPSYENDGPMFNWGYRYAVTGTALSAQGGESAKEIVQVLERPLTQYFSFFDGDLNLRHPMGTQLTTWGRIHANGDIYLGAAAGILLDDEDELSNIIPTALTATGDIYLGEIMEQSGTPASSATNNNQMGLDPSTTRTLNSSYDVTAATKGKIEKDFINPGGLDSRLRIGVDEVIPYDRSVLAIGGLYNLLAQASPVTNVDGMTILNTGGSLEIMFYPFGGSATDVTSDIQNYQHTDGTNMDFGTAPAPLGGGWSLGSLREPDGSYANNTDRPAADSMVYGPESQPTYNYADPTTPYTGAAVNPWFPWRLEMQDGRQSRPVEFTVIDLQRLQNWYRYVIAKNYGEDVGDRQLLIYAARTDLGGTVQAIKLIGSSMGRWRNWDAAQSALRDTADRQSNDTVYANTTIATPNPVYIDGDFNNPGNSGYPGGKSVAVLADSVTLLSNAWGINTAKFNVQDAAFDLTQNTASSTTYNAAFFVGRYDYIASSTSGPAAGPLDLGRLLEDWSGSVLTLRGCLSSPWYSASADSDFDTGGSIFAPPISYTVGWDPGFSTPLYTPPHVPMAYMIEREAWQEL